MYHDDDYYFIINNEEEEERSYFFIFIICFIEDKYKTVRFLIGRNREKYATTIDPYRGNNNIPYHQPQNKRVILPFFSFPKKKNEF